MRTTLEESVHRYVEAARTGDLGQLELVMSASALHRLKGNAARGGIELEGNLIEEMARDFPAIQAMEFHREIINGPTAGLVYKQDDAESDSDDPRVRFTFIKLVRPDANWLFDSLAQVSLPKYGADGQESEFNLSDLAGLGQKDLLLDGDVGDPSAVADEGLPFLLNVESFGHTTRVSIDATQHIDVSGAQQATRLLLAPGTHVVQILIRPAGEASPFLPVVTLEALETDGTYTEVLKFEPGSGAEGESEHQITVG